MTSQMPSYDKTQNRVCFRPVDYTKNYTSLPHRSSKMVLKQGFSTFLTPSPKKPKKRLLRPTVYSIRYNYNFTLLLLLLLLLSASPYSVSPQRDSIFYFTSIYFVSFHCSNPFHVFSHQIHPPSPWPSCFPSAWHRHFHHPFPHVVFFFPFYLSIPTYSCIPKFVCQLCNFRSPFHVFVSYLVLSCHSQCSSHHLQLCNFPFSDLSFRHCHRFHSIKHGWSNNTLVNFTLNLC